MAMIFRIGMYISSYIPVFIMIFLKNMNSFSIRGLKKCWLSNEIFWIVTLIILLIAFVILLLALLFYYFTAKSKKVKNSGIHIENLKSMDENILNVFVTYIIPLLSLNINSGPSVAMNIFFAFIEGIFFISNNAIYYNIMLIIMGFHVFSFKQGESIIISRHKRDYIINNDIQAYQSGTTNIYFTL